MKKLAIRLEEVSLDCESLDRILEKKVSKILDVPFEKFLKFEIVKRSVDSRSRSHVNFVYSVDVWLEDPENVLNKLQKFRKKDLVRHRIRLQEDYVYETFQVDKSKFEKRPVIVGNGPSGLFCALLLARAGLNPLVLERGNDVDRRVEDVERFFKTADLNVNSNIQFGAGGAGTFSDGKLNTLIKNPRIKHIFNELLLAGAPKDIAWQGHPHIGTDKLRGVVKNINKEIVSLGGEIRFGACLTDIKIENAKVMAVIVNDNEEILTDDLVLSIGHSARDTYEMLYEKGVDMERKVFSIGLRIEHRREMINKAQYKDFAKCSALPSARYKLVARAEGFRPVYTFCMCPGGYVVAAASEDGRLVTNGMSEYLQDAENSNSAVLVNVFPEDFESDHVLAGVEFQRKWEKKAFELGGGDFKAPAVLVGDFLNGRRSSKFGNVNPSYEPGVKLGSVDGCLPDYVLGAIRAALPILDRKVKGFAANDAVLTGVETRTTSPVRILRDEFLQSNVKGLYPSGEGAGYAGGIVSSAVDGLRVGEVIVGKCL